MCSFQKQQNCLFQTVLPNSSLICLTGGYLTRRIALRYYFTQEIVGRPTPKVFPA